MAWWPDVDMWKLVVCEQVCIEDVSNFDICLGGKVMVNMSVDGA